MEAPLVKVAVLSQIWIIPKHILDEDFFDAIRILNQTPDLCEVPWKEKHFIAFHAVQFNINVWKLP